METMIASLEEELATAHKEREEAVSRKDSLTSELEALSVKLDISNAELNALQDEASHLVIFYAFCPLCFLASVVELLLLI